MVLTEALTHTKTYLTSWLPGSGSSETLEKEIRIKSIYVHPIKSCRGSSVGASHYTNDGLKFDRQWLIIDRNTRRFCTARELSRMILIEPEIDAENNVLRIRVPLSEQVATIEVPLEVTAQQLSELELVEDIAIWAHKVDGYAVSAEADAVLSEFFEKEVRLVRKGPTARPSGPDDRRTNATLNFQDFYPLLVANEASIEHVQQTLLKNLYPSMSHSLSGKQQQMIQIPDVRVPPTVELDYWTPEQLASLPIIRFRPNIVLESEATIDGTPKLLPWEEDGFLELELFESGSDAKDIPFGQAAKGKGKLGISCMARCARCTVTCIDPETGKRDPHLPYKALQGFRQVDPLYKKIGKPSFGVLSAVREEKGESEGVIRVGDIVRVTAAMDASKRVSSPK